MHRHIGLSAVVLAVGLTACSREEPAQDQTGGLAEGSVYGDQVKALDKARDVQQTLDEAATRTRESVERQERQ